MDTPGISVEPIITLAGDHEVNQVFFDDVRVPQANRVGPENEGWTVAKYLLEFERGGGGAAARLMLELDELRAVAGREQQAGVALLDDACFRGQLSALDIRARALQFAELASLARMSRGESPGPASSLAKNASVAIEQDLRQLKLEAIHYYALPHASAISLNGGVETWVGPAHAETVTARYLNSRAASIFGGSQEVQKNIIAKVVLGL
jgi:acyl-CoA dehydrogenase